MLGFSPYSAAAFSDLGSGEQLFVATGVVNTGEIGDVVILANSSGRQVSGVESTASYCSKRLKYAIVTATYRTR